ncbi:MAG TPA: DUF433 domain-containing protein [Candidatus Omnitrophota bacterium]|nr:DUF433 domain-containing protein [Candidatus Omnitrophota bacterium]
MSRLNHFTIDEQEFRERVPLQALIDYLESGYTIDQFLEGFPTVTKQQVIQFLDEAG